MPEVGLEPLPAQISLQVADSTLPRLPWLPPLPGLLVRYCPTVFGPFGVTRRLGCEQIVTGRQIHLIALHFAGLRFIGAPEHQLTSTVVG